MENIRKYLMYIVKCILASAAGLGIGYLIASPFYAAVIETQSANPIRLVGFAVGIAATFAIGVIENRKKISGLSDIKKHLGQIVEDGMILSMFTVTASAGGIIYLMIVNYQPLSIMDYLLIISGIAGFLAEGWFFACLMLIPLILRDLFVKSMISS